MNLNARYWFYIRVKYQRIWGENGTKERHLCEEATDGRLQQIVDWWCGKCACGHCKKPENHSHYQSIQNVAQRCVTVWISTTTEHSWGSTRVKPHSVLTKIPIVFLDSIVTWQLIIKPYHISVLPHCHYPNDEDLNIWDESRANKLVFGKNQVRVSRT